MKDLFQHISILITCLLMLLAIAISKHRSVLGYGLDKERKEASADTATISEADDGSTIINTTNIANDVRGYGGAVPLKVYIKEGKIDSIEVLDNAETPDFLDQVKEQIISKYIGKTVSEAKKLNVDAVSGATFSSRAVKENLRRSLAVVPSDVEEGDTPSNNLFDIKLIVAAVVSLAAAIIPHFYRNRRYRIVQQACNVLILGLYAGTFVSYTSMTVILASGPTWENFPLITLLVTALLYPLLGKREYYCAWVCPFGSAQELMSHVSKRKIKINPEWAKRLDWFQKSLWAILMLLAWSGICLEWMDYELFSAFLWQSASWVVIAFAVFFLILSLFIHRPYCRFICPTGVILKSL